MIALATHGYLTHMPRFKSARALYAIMTSLSERGNTNSEFTSWTSDYEVAKNYALRPEGTGVILKKNFSNQQITKSPDLKSIILKQGGGTVKENEKLIKGNVSGAEVIKNP